MQIVNLEFLTPDLVQTGNVSRGVYFSRVPVTGEIVKLASGELFEVFHPVLKATLRESAPNDFETWPTIVLKPAFDCEPNVTEVAAAMRTAPVKLQLLPGREHYTTRQIAHNDGVDIEIQSSMVGHHVFKSPNGLFLEMAQMKFELLPDGRRRYLATH
jgi:hypothetical protein